MAREPSTRPSPDPHDRVSLVEQELLNSLDWLISLRWFAGATVLLATPLATAAFRVQFPAALLSATGFGILAYNTALWWTLHFMRRMHPDDTVRFEAFARAQIALDWIAMAVLIALSGGAESPANVFFLFHITIASLLLPHHLGFLYVSLAPTLVAGEALLEYAGVVPHVAMIQPPRFRDPAFVAMSVGFFTVACYVMAYCCMAIARRLRRRESELAGLYDSVRDIASTIEISTVLERIAEAASRVLRCRATAIRLIDPSRSQVEFAASYGLSEAYRDEVPAEFARSMLDQDTIREGVVHVVDVATDGRVWQPDRVRDEGIASMLSVPIVGHTAPMGVLRAYGAPGHRFGGEDVTYLQAVAAQGAVAIEHAKAYRLLADLDRDKSRFLRMTTHELRSPVRVTESLLMTLSDGYAGALGAEQSEVVRRALKRLHLLHALIDDLLDLAAGKAHMAAPQQRVVDLREIVREVLDRYQALARQKCLALVFEAPTSGLDLLCDPADLERLVVNLVSNAVKYTQHGSVTITLSGDDDHVRLEVADTGIGIPQDALPHLFKEFYRASNAKAVEESGTGLGLSIVKLLVERYGGHITIASVEGQGTTFSVEMARAGVTDAHSAHDQGRRDEC
jgi:signal transduction histidine kinase